jgi:lysophospholipase L1-like esterase
MRTLVRCASVHCAVLIPLALLGGAIATVAAASPSTDGWVGAWGFPPTSFTPAPAANVSAPQQTRGPAPPPDLNNVTVRQVVRIAAAATRVRIRFSNEFGDKPMRVGAAHVALLGDDGAIVPGSDHALTFSGQSAITIPANAPMFSDPVDWQVPALTTLAVSVYLPEDTVPPAHRLMEYVSSAGNFADAEKMPGATLVRSGALASEVEIVSPSAKRVVVTLGDSITEGVGSTPNAFKSWSDRLADRLAADPATRGWSVVNAGIGSNRLLHNNPGTGALARFDRDVLGVPGVAMVLMLEGINDIGYSQTTPAEAVTSEQIIEAYRQLIARAHAHGVAIVAATITPFEDSHYYDLHGEQMRQEVNHWIRTGGAFDGVVDFDAVLRDPAHPTQVLSTLHRGDHLHPNDAGYAAMGDTIDLKLFTSTAAVNRKRLETR